MGVYVGGCLEVTPEVSLLAESAQSSMLFLT